MNKTLRLRATIDITYRLKKTYPQLIKNMLHNVILNACSLGNYTGHTAAEIKTWGCNIVEVKEKGAKCAKARTKKVTRKPSK